MDAVDAGLHQLIDAADGRPVVVRLTLSGQGELNRFLRQPNTVDDLLSQINGEWSSRTPFAWCERIENLTASPFDRHTRLRSFDFLAEVLRTADRSYQDEQLQATLRNGLQSLYAHRRFRRQLSDAEPTDEELATLIAEAEAIAIDLLAEDDA